MYDYTNIDMFSMEGHTLIAIVSRLPGFPAWHLANRAIPQALNAKGADASFD